VRTYISTLVFHSTSVSASARIQNELNRLTKEVSTGRMADVGLSLGTQTGRSMRLHIDTDALTAFTNSNAMVSARLSQTDNALSALASDATSFSQALISGRNAGTARATLVTAANDALGSFASRLNTADGGDYIFGGINSGTAPIADFDSGPKAAIVAAFTAKFGFAPTDPAAAGLDAASMNDFLDNEFADLFNDANWSSTWSSASDQVMQSRISPGETVTSSVSANESAFRQLAMGYAMMSVFGSGSLGDGATDAVIDKAITTIGNGQAALTAVQAAMGSTENRIAGANTRLATQKDILATQIDNLEGVDPAVAKTKIDTLSTQLEMSYSLTAKLIQLSLVNYV